jgi:hypothetical protein
MPNRSSSAPRSCVATCHSAAVCTASRTILRLGRRPLLRTRHFPRNRQRCRTPRPARPRHQRRSVGVVGNRTRPPRRTNPRKPYPTPHRSPRHERRHRSRTTRIRRRTTNQRKRKRPPQRTQSRDSSFVRSRPVQGDHSGEMRQASWVTPTSSRLSPNTRMVCLIS